jgi:hypothetical protein
MSGALQIVPLAEQDIAGRLICRTRLREGEQ